jgi:hypothetical protein
MGYKVAPHLIHEHVRHRRAVGCAIPQKLPIAFKRAQEDTCRAEQEPRGCTSFLLKSDLISVCGAFEKKVIYGLSGM